MKTIRTHIVAAALALSAAVLPMSQAVASPTWTSCTPVNSMSYANRVHVKCSAAVSGISYFAVSSSNADTANRAMSTINAAMVSGRNLNVLYDPADLSGSSIGCSNSDCRLIQAIGLK